MIKLIGFDLDNTLWPVKPAILGAEAALKQYFEAFEPKLVYPPANIADFRSRVLDRDPDLHFRLTDLRRNLLQEIVLESKTHAASAESIVGQAMQIFLKARSQVTLYPGVASALQNLHANYSLCALTNGNADTRGLSIGPLFDFQMSAEDVGAPKPKPNLFLAALAKAQCQPSEMIYVGDDPVLDIEAAAQLGIHTIWITPNDKPQTKIHDSASEVISSIDELPEAVSAISAKLSSNSAAG